MKLEQPLTLTITQASQIAGCSRGKMHKMIRRGAIPTVDLDGSVRVHRERFLKQLHQGGFKRPEDTQKYTLVSISSRQRSKKK